MRTTLNSYTNGLIVGAAMFAENGAILAERMASETGRKWEWFITPTPDSVPTDCVVSPPVKVGGEWGRLILR